MKFSISVIIPAYNVEKFIEKAIRSALDQPEVIEVVVVNDGSIDNTVKIVMAIAEFHPKIKLYHHTNKVNKGRSSSRNLGINMATGNFIAFLDADDYYLKDRFNNDKVVFEKNNEIEGIYNAIGAHFYHKTCAKEKSVLKLFTVKEKIKSEKLFDTLLSGKLGYFSIDGLTIKKSVFRLTGLFNESLVVAEDTDIIWKMALKCRLVGGIIDKPVAMRGVHGENVFNRKDLYEIYDLKLYESMYIWSSKNHFDVVIIERFLERIWILKYRKKEMLLKYIMFWFQLNLKSPRLLISYLSLKYFPVIRLRKKLFPFLYK